MPPRKGKRKVATASGDNEPLDFFTMFLIFGLSISVAYIWLCGWPVDSTFFANVANSTNFNASAVGDRFSGAVSYFSSVLNATRARAASLTVNANVTDRAVGLLWSVASACESLSSTPAFRHLVVSVSCGLFLTLYCWYMLYWDSAVPGKLPPSPQWPWNRRNGDGLTVNQGIVLLLGPIASARMYRELHGSWELW